jgi:hypothetical protein
VPSAPNIPHQNAPFNPPQNFGPVQYQTPSGYDSALRTDGRHVIATSGAIFPERCIKCNTADDIKMIPRSLNWSPPWMYLLLIFPGLLIGGIIIIATQRKANVIVGVCQACRKKRLNRILIGWGIFVASLLAFFLAAYFESGIPAIFGLLLFLTSLIYAIVACGLISPARIDGSVATIRGICPDFLNSLNRR